MWYSVKTVFRGNFIILNVYIKKGGSSEINNINFFLKKLEKSVK